ESAPPSSAPASNAATRSASRASVRPTALREPRPTAWPRAARLSAITCGTRFAASSGSSFSWLFADASAATIASRTRPPRTACLTWPVPGTSEPARAASPSRRSAASGSRILPAGLFLRGLAAIARIGQTEDLGRDLAGLGELRGAGAATLRGRLGRRFLDRELIDQAQHLVRVLGGHARD